MDDSKVVQIGLTQLDRAWIVKALASLRQSLIRSRAKEMPGSEIWALRARELDMLEVTSRKMEVTK